MSVSTSRLAYTDCYKVLDQALTDEVGARVRMSDMDKANYLRMRLNQARSIDRKDNCQLYDEDHPLYGRSVYDVLIFRLRQIDDEAWVYVEHIGLDLGEIEPLSQLELEGPDEVLAIEPPPAPLQIEHIKRRL